jgi:hypothetical protein
MKHEPLHEPLEARLMRATDYLLRGDRCIDRMKLVVERKMAGGHDAEEALRMLENFRAIQASHAECWTKLAAERRFLIP